MKENGIFLILILLAVSFNCDKNNLQSKTFLKTNSLIEKASDNTNSKATSNSSPASSNSNGASSSNSSASASSNSNASASSNSNATASSNSNGSASSNANFNPNTPASSNSASNSSSASSASSASNSSSASSNGRDVNSTSSTISSNTSSSSISQNVTASDNSNTSNKTNNSSNSSAEEQSICAEVGEYQKLLLEVDQSLEELMHAFEDHYKDLLKWANSSEEAVDRQKWKESVKDMLDYYINKTGELLRVYSQLNNSIYEMKTQYCSPKPSVVEPVKNNTEGKKAEQTLNISYNTSTATTEQKVTTPQTNESTTAGAGESSVMTIFIQKMQEVATKAGLPVNYVQTRLREISRRHNRRMKRLAIQI